MSYRPPKKSPYGDELIDDTWTAAPPSTSTPPPPPPLRPPSPLQQQSPLNYQPGQPGVQAPGGNFQNSSASFGHPPNSQTNVNSSYAAALANMQHTITAEDILFMRNWQRDSFYYRVLPITFTSWGALYAYNRHKQLPQAKGRFVLATIASYFIGKWMYRDNLRQRLATSRSNTPYMQALRKMMGVTPAIEGADSFRADDGFDYGRSTLPDGTTNWSNTATDPWGSGATRQADFSKPIQAEQPFPGPGDSQLGTDPPKAGTTYDELRAKNRGLIR